MGKIAKAEAEMRKVPNNEEDKNLFLFGSKGEILFSEDGSINDMTETHQKQ